jgi:hypothetical protein
MKRALEGNTIHWKMMRAAGVIKPGSGHIRAHGGQFHRLDTSPQMSRADCFK